MRLSFSRSERQGGSKTRRVWIFRLTAQNGQKLHSTRTKHKILFSSLSLLSPVFFSLYYPFLLCSGNPSLLLLLLLLLCLFMSFCHFSLSDQYPLLHLGCKRLWSTCQESKRAASSLTGTQRHQDAYTHMWTHGHHTPTKGWCQSHKERDCSIRPPHTDTLFKSYMVYLISLVRIFFSPLQGTNMHAWSDLQTLTEIGKHLLFWPRMATNFEFDKVFFFF